MGVPSARDLVNPVLVAIREAGGSALIGEITESVIRDLGLSEDDANQPHGTGGTGYQTELEYRLGWARWRLKKYGVITNSNRGVWALTPRGERTGKIDPGEVDRAIREAERIERESSERPDSAIPGGSETGEDPEASWKDRLLEVLSGMSPDAFERLCQRMLRESGFIEVTVTGRSGDGGIDGHGIIRMGGLISFPVLFQCKRWQGSIGSGVVRDFRGAMAGRSDKGLLITTGSFTRDAKAEATRDGAPPMDLIDGSLLADKLKELEIGVKTETVVEERVVIDGEFFERV